MICGATPHQFEWEAFPYRSSSRLTRFFRGIDQEYTHDGSTRFYWVLEVLEELNRDNASDPRFPSDSLVDVICHLIDPLHFEQDDLDHEQAVKDVAKVLTRDGFHVSFVEDEVCIEHIPTKTKPSSTSPKTRPLSPAEKRRRDQLLHYLKDADEDEFTEHVVVPLFQFLGYSRVTQKGHREKTNEFGKDLWMKLGIPSDHVLYFGAQVKIDRIHASTKKPSQNIATILSQLEMMFEHPVFDAGTNSQHLVDHAYLISSGEITEQARDFISRKLSRTMKRRILFMDQSDFVRMWALTNLELPDEELESDEDIPF